MTGAVDANYNNSSVTGTLKKIFKRAVKFL